MAGKNDMREKAKSLWLKGMKAIGNTAASIANNTRYKVDEVTLQNRRREILNDLANKAYALWLKGESFPDQMSRMLEELKLLDEQLNDMRAEKYSSGRKIQQPDIQAAEHEDKEEDISEDTVDPSFVPTEGSPVRAEINELFDGTPSVGRAAEKVNSSLEQMSDRIHNFPPVIHDDPEDEQEPEK